MRRNRKPSSQMPNRRRGVAVVELAVCLPVLVLVAVATIDACTIFHVQQTLKITAYEGARVGIVPEANATNVRFQCETMLDNQGVQAYHIAMDPADPSTLTPGDYFTVTTSADFNQNALVGGIYAGKVLTRSVTLRAE